MRKLHHIGYVVPNILPAMGGFLRVTGGVWDEQIFEDPHQKVKVAFLKPSPDEPLIELVQPVGENSPVRAFLTRKGGLHHFCYETADLDATIGEMRAVRAMLVKHPLPAVAFGGRRIAWMLTQENLLVELLETGLVGT